MAISINAKELEKVLATTPAEQNVMLVGKHGIGKSEILTKYYKNEGMKVVTLFLGQMSDPGDLIGLPNKNEKTSKTDFMPPYWFPTDEKPIVLFLDELNRARPEVLQTIMDLTLNRTLAGRRLPDGSRIISAVNDGEEYQLTDLDPALVSRFNIYNFRPTVAEWLLWASENGLDERVVNFISENNSFLDDTSNEFGGLEKSPDRRAWKRVSDIIKGADSLQNIHKKIIGGIIGVKATNHFYEFVASSKALSGKEAMLHFSKHKAEVGNMPLHELSILNESIFRFIETDETEKDGQKDTICRALTEYVELLLSQKKKEAFAHWISLYTDGNYPKAIAFVLVNIPKLYKRIQQFISDL